MFAKDRCSLFHGEVLFLDQNLESFTGQDNIDKIDDYDGITQEAGLVSLYNASLTTYTYTHEFAFCLEVDS